MAELNISIITLGELYFGAQKSQAKDKALKVIRQLAKTVQIAHLDQNVATHYADIRYQLQQQGNIIGNNDLWLAAHARANNWIMVTNNEKEFLRVQGLSVQNWTQ